MALGWAMYGLWVVFLAVAGRAKVTERNFPAAIAGLAANVILLLVLVPPLGLAGAGLALCGAYVVMLGLMHLLTRRAFPVDFEWRRLAQLTLIVGGLAAAGRADSAHLGRRGLHQPRARCGRSIPPVAARHRLCPRRRAAPRPERCWLACARRVLRVRPVPPRSES